MEDVRWAIENLLADYTLLLDNGDWAGLGRLFASGSVSINGGPADGRTASGASETAALYRDIVMLDADTNRTGTRHLISNLHLRLLGPGAAQARCYFCVLQQTAVLQLQPVATGLYEDLLKCVDGKWAFSERVITCDQTGDLSQHMR